MSTQDNLEKILRQMHVLISKGESFENSKDKVIIKKQDMLDLLKDLNICVYQDHRYRYDLVNRQT